MPVSISRALGLATTQAEALPLPAELYPLGVKIRKANLVMIAGAPGVGKSMFADWLVWRMGMTALSFSADMTPFDSISRAAARVTGDSLTTVESGLKGGGVGYYDDALHDLPIDYCFDSSLSLDLIVAELDAYVEINDAWPQLIVVDHLNKVEGSEDFMGQKYILSELHTLAHLTASVVIVLHHASQVNTKDLTKPAPGREIENKVTQYPEVILTVALDQATETFSIAAVKNRSGKSDPGAKSPLTLACDPARCTYSTARSPEINDWWSREVN